MIIKNYNLDTVCSSESFLDSTVPISDGNIIISKYLLLRANHPKNIKQEGVRLCFKELLPSIKRHDLSNKKECLVTKVNVNYEKIKSSQQVKIPMS